MGQVKAGKYNFSKLSRELEALYVDLLIPFMKVRRDMPFPTEPERSETDGEHAFSLSMFALTINDRLKLGLDNGKIAQYALVHDLVEAHAGDISARSTDEEQLIKIDREREASLIIKKQFTRTTPWIPRLIEAYEAKSDEESKFVYAVDKLMGSYTWIAGKGAGWSHTYTKQDGSDYHRVVARLRKKASVYPELLPLFDLIHEQLNQARKRYAESS